MPAPVLERIPGAQGILAAAVAVRRRVGLEWRASPPHHWLISWPAPEGLGVRPRDLRPADPEGGRRIRQLGAKAGVVFNPSTSPEAIRWMMDDVDLVLVMSVNPGFGGQSFMTSQLKKIEALRAMIDACGKDIALEVDGGVNPETARQCVAAGATALVAGSAVFKGGPSQYAANIAALRGA